ncbi:MAG: SPOR domain-containing protein [Bacteroidota bacterium]|nr:SPOR domain-containing protein [Bacteroidota bacterium]
MRVPIASRLLILLLPLWVVACSSSAPLVDDPVDDTPSGPTTWAKVETVDMSQYPDIAPAAATPLEHDVPLALMNSTADDGAQVELSGFRVQVFSSSEREEAVTVEDEARRWLNGLSEGQRNALGLPETVPVYSIYRQPFYRIRVGDFEFRDDASRLATTLQRRFPGALVVPDRVTIMR